MIRIKEITPGQAMEKCYKTSQCNNCQLNYKHWCIVKNSKDQLRNCLSKKEYEKYMNIEVYL